MAIPPGTTVGRYRVLREVGRGDFVTVYRAVDLVQRCAVTLKVLEASQGADDAIAQRFQQEAEAALRLAGHPHVLAVHTAGRLEGMLFIVTEFLPGATLDQSLSGPLDLALAVKIVTAVASALDAAHRVGLVHRDVKPANILLGRDGRIVLSDFGIAGLISDVRHATQAIHVLGTPEYLAPELARGAPPSAASDQYALAVVAYEMLTGSRPFPEKDPLAILYAHVHVAPPQPTLLRTKLPPEVDEVLLRGLAKDPQERFPDCTAFAVALRTALGLAEETAPAAAHADAGSPVDALLQKTRELMATGEYAAALRAVQAARAIIPDEQRLQLLEAELAEELRLAERYDRALRHLRVRDWLPAREILNALYAERPDYRDVATLREQAFAAIRQNWEKEQRLRAGRDPLAARNGDRGEGKTAHGTPDAAPRRRKLSERERLDEELSWRYEAAVAAIEDRNWRTALLILEGISERAPQYRDVPALLRRVQNALAREERTTFAAGWPAKLTYRPARFLRRMFAELLAHSRRRRRALLDEDVLAEPAATEVAAPAEPNAASEPSPSADPPANGTPEGPPVAAPAPPAAAAEPTVTLSDHEGPKVSTAYDQTPGDSADQLPTDHGGEDGNRQAPSTAQRDPAPAPGRKRAG